MRNIIFLILCVADFVFPPSALAIDLEEERLFKGKDGASTIRVLSSTDTSVFEPTITGFLSANPAVNIEYLVAGSADIYTLFRQSPEQYDIVISSAMDLQLKLVNDGFALQVQSITHPEWAQWRQSLYGFTLEPAGIVINKQHFKEIPVPTSRQELIEVLRKNPDKFRGKVATYDVRQSGLGYLFATQDARDSETYWRLMEIMGSLDAELYCCSGGMIDDVSTGDIAIAYNVLTSYASARTDAADAIELVQPSDFSNVMMRTVLISEKTKHSKSAMTFLRYLTALAVSNPPVDELALPSLRNTNNGTQSSVISLEPGLMIFLDRLKRQTFINEWESAIIQ